VYVNLISISEDGKNAGDSDCLEKLKVE